MATKPFSARFSADVLERLENRSARAGVNKSKLAERYVDEGTRMDEHPGIEFRDGPAGRRAALPGGPDVWEVLTTLEGGSSDGEEAVADAANVLELPVERIRVALRYYAAYPGEIDVRVRRHFDDFESDRAAWEATHRLEL